MKILYNFERLLSSVMKKMLLLLVFLPVFLQAQSIHITASADTICSGTPVKFSTTATGTGVKYYQWKVNGITAGADSSQFTTTTLNDGDTIRCLLTNSAHDTIKAISDSIIIIVHQMPNAGIITGIDSEVCVGATITLSDSVAGGVWSVAINNVRVNAGIVTGINTQHEFNMAATDTVFYSVSNAHCTNKISRVVTINPQANAHFTLDIPFGGSSTLCIGATVSINFRAPAPSLHGTTGKVAVWPSFISPRSVGDDYIYNIVTNVCGWDSFGMWVFVGPAAEPGQIVPASYEVCVGSVVSLSVAGGVGSPIWQTSNGNLALNYYTPVNYFTGIKPGLDTLYLRAMNACGFTQNTTSAVIKINPMPVAVFENILMHTGDMIQLSDSGANGIWTSSNADIASIDTASGLISGVKEGAATVTYSLPTGCYVTNKVAVTKLTDQVTVFPNPATDNIVIHQDLLINQRCSIINAFGQPLLEKSLSTGYNIVSIESLPKGIYCAVLDGNKGKHTYKFLKQ